MTVPLGIVLCAATLCLGVQDAPRQQEPDPFVGRFRHTEFELELRPTIAGYVGFLNIRGHRFEVHAQREGEELAGYILMDGHRYKFTGRAEEDAMMLFLPIARNASDIRRSFGQYTKQRYRARRVEPSSAWSSCWNRAPMWDDESDAGFRMRSSDTTSYGVQLAK